MKLLSVVALTLALCTTGCGLFAVVAPALPKVAAILSDASSVLSIIQQATSTWFTRNPNRELEDEANRLISSSWMALRAASAATNGVEDLSQEQYEAAFSDFKNSYAHLHEFLKTNGLLNGSTLGSGTASEIVIPPPIALDAKID